MIAAGLTSNINVLAQLDVTIRSQDEEPPIAPHAQSIRRKPIHANVARSAVTMHHHVAEILKFRVRWMIHIRDLCCRHLSLGRAGVVNELVCLVGTDIAKNPAILSGIPKPVRPADVIHFMGSDIHCLHDLANRSGLDQIPGLYRRTHF